MKTCLCLQIIFWGDEEGVHDPYRARVSHLRRSLWPVYVSFSKMLNFHIHFFLNQIVTHFKKALVNFILKSWSLQHLNRYR